MGSQQLYVQDWNLGALVGVPEFHIHLRELLGFSSFLRSEYATQLSLLSQLELIL